MAQIDIPVNAQTRAALAGIRSMASAVTQLSNQIARLTTQLNNSSGASNRAGASANRAGQQARGAASGFAAASSAISKFNSGMGGLKGAIAAVGIVGLGKDIVQTATTMNGLRQSLNAITGSAAAGGASLATLSKISNEVGFRTLDLGKAYVQLTAATQGTTLQGQATTTMFTNLAKATALYGGSTDDLQGALTAVQQITSKGQVQMEELKGQLGERLPGALRILADGLGITTTELNKMVSDGKLGATEFYKAFDKGLSQKLPKDIQAAGAEFARFQNTLDQVKVDFANSGFLDGLIQGMRALSAELKKPEVQAGIKQLGKDIGDMIVFITKNYESMKFWLSILAGLVIIGKVAGWIVALSGAITALTGPAIKAGAAIRAFGSALAAIAANPIALIGAAIAVLILGLAALKKAFDTVRQTGREYSNEAKVNKQIQDSLTNSLRTQTATTADAANKNVALARSYIARQQAALAAAKGELALAQAQLSTFGGRVKDFFTGGVASNQVKQNQEAIKQLQANIAEGQRVVKENEAAAKALAAAANPVGLVNPDSLGGKDTKPTKSDAEREAEQQAKRYKEALEELRDSIVKAGLSDRDAAAFTAIRSAGLKTALNATDAQTKAVRELAYAQFDAEKKRDDMKQAVEDEIQATGDLVRAQQDLAAVNKQGIAGTQALIENARREYDEKVRLLDKLSLEEDQRKRLLDLYAQTRDVQINTAQAEQDRYVSDTRTDLTRDAEDNALNRKGLGGAAKMRPEELELERQNIAIERARADALKELGENLDTNSAEYIELAQRINENADEQKQFLADQLKENKSVEQFKELSSFFTDMFTKPKEAMRDFFTQLLTQMLQTIAYSAIMGKSMGDSFGALFGKGDGVAGGILGSLFGGKAGGAGAGGFLKKIFGGFFANGGDLPRNKFSVVGEKGPELVYNKGANRVIPNNKAFGNSGGGSSFSMGDTHIVVNNAAGMDANQLSIHVAKQQERTMRNLIQQEIKRSK